MAKLYIREYAEIPKVGDDIRAPIPGAIIAEQVLDISGTSNPSAAFNDATRYIEVSSDIDCHVKVGDSTPIAAAASCGALWARQWHPFAVKRGQKIAVIQAAS